MRTHPRAHVLQTIPAETTSGRLVRADRRTRLRHGGERILRVVTGEDQESVSFLSDRASGDGSSLSTRRMDRRVGESSPAAPAATHAAAEIPNTTAAELWMSST